MKDEPALAGRYIVVTHGCGTSCQVNWIINAESGKVLGNIGSTYGIDYRLDSRLIIRNQPDYAENDPEMYGLLRNIDYYIIENDEIKLIKRLAVSRMYVDDLPIFKERVISE